MITVIVPNYNGELYIARCLDSIVNQTYKDIEIIISDNMSTDKSVDIVKEYCERHDNIRLVMCTNGQGVSYARNFAISQARGEYIYPFDSDDELYEDALGILVKYASKYNADITASLNDRQTGDSVVPVKSDAPTGYAKSEQKAQLVSETLLSYAFINPPKLYRLDFLRENNIQYKHVALGEDVLFNIEALDKASCICFVNKSLYLYRVLTHGMNYQYRENYIEQKSRSVECIKSYLQINNQLGKNYYIMLSRDVFSIILNESRKKGKFNGIYHVEQVAELLESNVFEFLPFSHKVIFILLKLRSTLLLKLCVFIWRKLNL